MNNNFLNSIIHLFSIIVMMVTFSWLGLTDFAWYEEDSLSKISNKSVNRAQLAPSVLLPLKVIENHSVVQSMRVGPGGHIAANYNAFNQILAHPQAESAFEFLLNSNNDAAKVYALHGLKHLNHSRFKQLEPYFLTSKKRIHQTIGCLGSFPAVSEAMELLDSVHPLQQQQPLENHPSHSRVVP